MKIPHFYKCATNPAIAKNVVEDNQDCYNKPRNGSFQATGCNPRRDRQYVPVPSLYKS